MADQATLNGRARFTDDAPEGIVGSLAEFGNDVASLVELQARLAVLDMKETSRLAAVPSGMAVMGLVLTLASVPVALLGLADLLSAWLRWSPGASRLAVAAGAMVVAGILATFGWKGVSASLSSFQRSKEELTRNISWIRTVIVHSGRSLPRGRW